MMVMMVDGTGWEGGGGMAPTGRCLTGPWGKDANLWPGVVE